jgi:protease-4
MIVVYAVLIAVAVVGGYYLAQQLVPTPKIGVIRLEGAVGSVTAEVMAREVQYARTADDIRGVLLIVNSPGGGAASGHDIYMQIRKLREVKPVVASIEVLAASAAYQVAVAANEIYGKPASIIGNVGVIFTQPRPEVLSEQFTTTGPFKATGGSPTSYLQMLDLLHADFRDSVVAERSKAPNPLNLPDDQVATGEIWTGIQSKEFGIIDQIGSRLDALDATARLANVNKYDVVEIRDELLASLEGSQLESTLALYEEYDHSQVELNLTSEETEWPAFYQIYIPLE